MERKKKKRFENMKFVVYGLLFALLLALPITHAQAYNTTATPFTGISTFISSFGNQYLFALVVFILIAFFTGSVHLPWPPSTLLYIVTFSLFSLLGIFSFNFVILIMMFVAGSAAYGMTKIIADLIFA